MGSSNSKQQQRNAAPSTRTQRRSRGSSGGSTAAKASVAKVSSVPASSSDADPEVKSSRSASSKERREGKGPAEGEVSRKASKEGKRKQCLEEEDMKKEARESKEDAKGKEQLKDSKEGKHGKEKESKRDSKKEKESKRDSKKEKRASTSKREGEGEKAEKAEKEEKAAKVEKAEIVGAAEMAEKAEKTEKGEKEAKVKDTDEEVEEEKGLFRALKAPQIRAYIASGAVAKEWSELLRAEMLDNRRVAVHMQKDRYYGRFVYEHSRVRLGGGFLNEDAQLDDEDAGSPPVSPISKTSAERDCCMEAVEEEEEEASEGLSGVEADSGSNELAAAIAAGACKPKLNSSFPGFDEESSATIYSDCDPGKESGASPGGTGAANEDGCEESSELFPSYSGSSEEDDEEEEEDNDYINANFLADGRYICTQAPVPETLVDFWRMVWEQEVNLVVMLTRLEEGDRIKAHRYWPTMDKMYKSYKGQFQVTILSEKVLVEEQIVVRRLALKDVRVVIPLELSSEGEESDEEEIAGEDSDIAESNPALEDSDEEEVDPDARVVTQLHYIGWPDHGVPNNFVYILEMLKLVDGQQKKQRLLREKTELEQKAKRSKKGKGSGSALKATKAETKNSSLVPPIVVHCSAGVGRSGTFVVAHMELTRLHEKYRERFGDGGAVEEKRWKELLNDEKLLIGSAVKTLRRDRRTMVQREEQLLFLYELFEHMAGEGNSAVIPFTSSSDI